MVPPTSPDTSSVILVGLMGVGKSSIGKHLAKRLNLPFIDTDTEIAKAAGCSIEDIFEIYGETAFREGEQRVINRILNDGPLVVATGGGAFMDALTRDRIQESGVSVWLRASLDVLVRRLGRRVNKRPMLKDHNLKDALFELIETRHPVYAAANIIIDTDDEPIDTTVTQVCQKLDAFRSRDGRDPGSDTR
jgi:shikimate kinase